MLGLTSVPPWQRLESSFETLPLDPAQNITIFSGERLPNFGRSSNQIDAQTLAMIQAGTAYLVVGGRVSYEDEFREAHETTFCLVYVPERPKAPPTWMRCPTTDVVR